MTTSTAKIFHDMAMNLSHEAKMSKTKGDESAYVEQMTKAFFLEKEAAPRMQSARRMYGNVGCTQKK